MSEKKDKVRALIEKGKRDGKLSGSEINSILEDLDFEEDSMTRLRDMT